MATKHLYKTTFMSNLQFKGVHIFTEKEMVKPKGDDLGEPQLEAAWMRSS